MLMRSTWVLFLVITFFVLSITLSLVVVYLRYWYHMDHTEGFPVVYKYVLFQYLQIQQNKSGKISIFCC